MAKIYGLSGAITGRRGADVFAVTNGIQTVRQYQPIVANPRTQLQLEQRSKMNTAGRFSKLVPKSLLAVMNAGNNRMNRSMFNKGLIMAATVEPRAKDEFVAVIPAADVKFSRGAAYGKATVSTPAAITDGKLVIGMTLAEADAAGKYAERLVVAVMNTENTNGAEAVLYKDVLFTDSNAQTININLPAGVVAGQVVNVYRCPIDLTEEGMRIATSGNYVASGDITGILAGTNGLVRNFGETIYDSTVNFPQA